MDERIAELWDRQEIVDVLYRYATALDSRDWELLASCFTEDAVADFLELGGVNEGVSAIVELASGVLSGLDSSQHLIGNPEVEVDGDRASSSCYLQAQHYLVSASGANTFLVGGTYRDRLVRTAEGWRIEHRTLISTWQDGNAGVFAEAAARDEATNGS